LKEDYISKKHPPLNEFIDFISEIHPLGPEAAEAFVSHLVKTSFSKKDTIVELGKQSSMLYFITKGAVREYIIDDNGNDISVWFGFENDIAVSLASFFSEEPSLTGLQAMEDVESFAIPRDSLYKLYDKFHDIERLSRLMVVSDVLSTEAYRRTFHHLTATQRYDMLITQSPEIIQRMPLTHIASFIGISLETLSRIRSKMS
jgi:CRP-like cAMP-binding protein